MEGSLGTEAKRQGNELGSEEKREVKYPFGKELKPRTTRRAKFRDYQAPGYYMITITAKEQTAPFCRISGAPTNPQIVDTPLGLIIHEKVQTMPDYTPQLRVLTHVLMPDHVHILIQVKERLERHLGKVIGGMMGGSTAMARKKGLISSEESLFKEKFHDRIVTKVGQIDTLRNYINDNPRRLLIKRRHPDLFKRYLHLQIGDREYAAYGNIFLLKYPDLLPVRIHRRWSEKEFDDYEDKCMAEIGDGTVPISPFIHKREKAIRDKTLEAGGKLIVLRDIGFEDRFKPQGKEFELCAAGRLLLLAPWPENTGRNSHAGYAEFHSLNDMAKAIAEMDHTVRRSIINR